MVESKGEDPMSTSRSSFLHRTRKILSRMAAMCTHEDEFLLATMLALAKEEVEDALREDYLSNAYEERLQRTTLRPSGRRDAFEKMAA